MFNIKDYLIKQITNVGKNEKSANLQANNGTLFKGIYGEHTIKETEATT